MGTGLEVERRLAERAGQLTTAERRIAETVLADAQIVAFGTVADLAAAAGVGTATVVRFAVKLGYGGYSELQASIRGDLSGRLRPAAERIREQPNTVGGELDQRHLDTEIANVRASLEGIDPVVLAAAVTQLADIRRPVLVLSGVASRGVALQFLGDLDQLRPGCRSMDGTPIDIVRTLADVGSSATVVAIDLRRYERWLLDAVGIARGHGASIIAVTDSILSPLAVIADHAFLVEAASAGPFDSQVGTLALLDRLVVDVAATGRNDATRRIDRLEEAWRAADALTD